MSAAISEPTMNGSPLGASTPVMLWFRDGNKGFEFNHLEDGHASIHISTLKVAIQTASWGKGSWGREHAWLDSNTPPTVLHQPNNEQAHEMALFKNPRPAPNCFENN